MAEEHLFGFIRKLKFLKMYEDYDRVYKKWVQKSVTEVMLDDKLNYKSRLRFKPDNFIFKTKSFLMRYVKSDLSQYLFILKTESDG